MHEACTCGRFRVTSLPVYVFDFTLAKAKTDVGLVIAHWTAMFVFLPKHMITP